MSGIARQMFSLSTVLNTVSGALFGSGSLSIPVGATLVTMTGQGGTGGDNSYYNPGQPYVAPSGYHAGQAYIAPFLEWGGLSGYDTYLSSTPVYQALPSPSYLGQTADLITGGGVGSETVYVYHEYVTQNPGQPYIAPYYDYPGQPYIAPSSGGGPYYGTDTTATLNGVTRTWVGGYATVGTPSVQTLSSTGAGQTLTYSVGSGGYINYSYTY